VEPAHGVDYRMSRASSPLPIDAVIPPSSNASVVASEVCATRHPVVHKPAGGEPAVVAAGDRCLLEHRVPR